MLMRLALLIVVFAASVSSGEAHAVDADPGSSSALEFIQAITVTAVTIIYALGVLRIRQRAGADRVVTRSQTLAFAAALTLFVVVVSPPVDDITDALFSAHMAQHLVLMLVIPPLAVWSRPIVVGLWAFPHGPRKAFVRSRVVRVLRAGVALTVRPVVVAVLFLGTFAFWHLPRPYAWSLESEWLHAFEHLTFLITAIMFWSLVIEPSGRRRMGHNATLLYVATIALLSGLPGALMMLSPVTLFRAHGEAPVAFGLTPLADQQIAGLIMWVPAGIFFLIPIAVLFVRGMQVAERRASLRSS